MSVSVTQFGFVGDGWGNGILDFELGSGTPATLYLAAFTVAPTSAGGGTECSWTGYARLAITNNVTNFPAASARSKANGATWSLGTVGAGGTFTCIGIALVKTSSGALGANDIVRYIELNPARVYTTGDSFTIAVGNAVFTIR